MTITINRRVVGIALGAAATLALIGGCTSSQSDAQSQGQAQTEQAYQQQSAAVPYPVSQLNDSLERRNLRERLLRYNNPSKISYIYLLSNTGGMYAFFTVKGKVSSNSSQMTTDQITHWACNGGNGGHCDNLVVNAPQDDGSYGGAEPGIFFFTSDNVMVTWDGPYLLTDAPMKVNPATTTLTYVDGSKPTSTGGK